jgi:hypothetical protein
MSSPLYMAKRLGFLDSGLLELERSTRSGMVVAGLSCMMFLRTGCRWVGWDIKLRFYSSVRFHFQRHFISPPELRWVIDFLYFHLPCIKAFRWAKPFLKLSDPLTLLLLLKAV